MALFDRIDGDHGDFENSQNFFESLNNSAKIFVKHCDVWETFGQTPKVQSLLVFLTKRRRGIFPIIISGKMQRGVVVVRSENQVFANLVSLCF